MHLIEHNSLEVNGDIGNANIIEKILYFTPGNRNFSAGGAPSSTALAARFPTLHGCGYTTHEEG